MIDESALLLQRDSSLRYRVISLWLIEFINSLKCNKIKLRCGLEVRTSLSEHYCGCSITSGDLGFSELSFFAVVMLVKLLVKSRR